MYHQLPDVYENSTCDGFQLDVSIAETNGAFSTLFYDSLLCKKKNHLHLNKKNLLKCYGKILARYSKTVNIWDIYGSTVIDLLGHLHVHLQYNTFQCTVLGSKK